MSYPIQHDGQTFTEEGKIPSVQEETFTCGGCNQEFPVKKEFTTGYGIFTTTQGEEVKICYACCAEKDKEQLRQTGKLGGYWTEEGQAPNKEVLFSNWPGSWKVKLQGIRVRGHNWGGYTNCNMGRGSHYQGVRQYYGYFQWEGKWYQVKHVSGGFTMIARVKELKRKPSLFASQIF